MVYRGSAALRAAAAMADGSPLRHVGEAWPRTI